jgi:phytanoyl-CoA dioxygenase PhyH
MRTFNAAATKDKIAEIQDSGYCILRAHLARPVVEACRDAFWPVLLAYLQKHSHEPNRGPNRHFLAMPFEPPCFAPDFFFDTEVLNIVRGLMDERVVADQWGCDVPLQGSDFQSMHVDFKHPLFGEAPDLALPVYMLVVSFGLVQITTDLGPIEIAPGTHRMPRADALRAVQTTEIQMRPVTLEIGDVLIRHPWALHRGTPNTSHTPRAVVSIRYVRRWYADDSREVQSIPSSVWESLTSEQRSLLRFPQGD